MFASARLNERRYRLSLDVHRYIEVVEAQDDGQPSMLSCGRGSTRSLTFAETSATGYARRQPPIRWKMRKQREKC